MTSDKRRNRDIQNLLAVLGASVICAGLLAFFFIHYYGPSGKYVAGQTILDPAIIQQINAQESDSKNRQKVHFVFDHFEFSYFDTQTGQMRRLPVSMENYQMFYQLVSSELSVTKNQGEMERLFVRSHPTLLTASMRTLNGSPSSNTKIFQVIEFIEEGYFRVQLHDKQEPGEWVYFYRANSYQDVMHLFTQALVLERLSRCAFSRIIDIFALAIPQSSFGNMFSEYCLETLGYSQSKAAKFSSENSQRESLV